MGSRGASAGATTRAIAEARAIEKTISSKRALVSKYNKKWIAALGGQRGAGNNEAYEKYTAEAGKWYDRRNQAQRELNATEKKLDAHLKKYKLGFYGGK